MLNATFETTPAFNAGINGLIQKCRINARTVVEKETGELIKMLVKVSPPRNLQASKKNVEATIPFKFELTGLRDFQTTSGQIGKSGVKWYSMDEKFLRGVSQEKDLRKASTAELKSFYYALTRKGRQILQFKHPRRRQRVMLSQKILITKQQMNKLTANIKSKFGRLKAGWCVAVAQGAIKIYGANMPPGWVTKHFSGARGDTINELLSKENPRFTIINRAAGIGNPQHNLKFYVNLALKARASAMKSNALLFMRGKKNIADYAR